MLLWQALRLTGCHNSGGVMPVLTFDGGNSSCSLPPFNAVSNQLFFFRVNAFEIALPVDAQGGGSFGGFRDKARLGLPITDLFPSLMPEYHPAFRHLGQMQARLDRRLFLPAAN